MRPPGAGAVSPTGETLYGVKIPLVGTSRGPNAIALAYTARAMWVKTSRVSSVVSGPKLTIFFRRT